MNRRSLIVAMAAAPALACAPSVLDRGKAPDGFHRLSSDKDDEGYRAWCILNGDGKLAKVYLDGVEQPDCLMADAQQGIVRRLVRTPGGNIAIGHGEALQETVPGFVEIVIS